MSRIEDCFQLKIIHYNYRLHTNLSGTNLLLRSGGVFAVIINHNQII